MAEKRIEQVERTRAALIAAGRRLFCERPVDAVTIDDIVRAAEVSKGSFYNHFPDRESLARAVIAQVRASIECAVDRANIDVPDPARRMARAICVYLRCGLDDPEQAGALIQIDSGQTSISIPLNQGLLEDIAAGLAAGRFTLTATEPAVLYVLGVAQLALIRVTEEPTETFAVSFAQQICALLLRGLGVAGAESELIAAQAADELVRRSPGPHKNDPEGASH